MIKRPMLLSSISVVFCILLYYFFGLYPFIAGLLLCLGVIAFLHKSVLNICLFALVFLSVFISALSLDKTVKTTAKLRGKQFTANFIICEETVQKKRNCMVVKSYDNGILPDKAKFYLYYSGKEFSEGEKITAKVKAMAIDGADFKRLNIDGIYGRLYLMKTVGKNGCDLFYGSIGKIRKSVKGYFRKNLSYASYATLIAILLGDKSGLSQSLYDNVKTSGVSHIMAVSGLHLSVIMGLLFFLIDRTVKNKILRFLLICSSIIFICALCSFSASIVRAGVMFVMFAVPPLFNRGTDRLSVLCLTVVLNMIFSPLVVLNISFQMSVAAVFAVMIVLPVYIEWLKERISFNNKFLLTVFEALLISVFAQIFTAPFSIYAFRMISIAAPFTTLIIALAVTLALQLGIISYLLRFLILIPAYLLYVIDVDLAFINRVIEAVGSIKYSAFNVPGWTSVFPAILAISLVAGMYYINRRKENGLPHRL
ncbi:MAG TPA: hypothetical protein DEW35_05105 [Ruminococcaceae bacterium]|nr:hypothetical protein [Oscillospiraceae bacterium]